MKLSEDLRRSVLQAAIQGKLTEQKSEDGNIKKLLYHIRQEKEKLIASGKLKKEKPLPIITDKEKPFEIPENWEWERWGNLSFSIQYGYNAPALKNGAVKMVRISDIQDNKIQWSTVPYCEISDKEMQNYILVKNDILFARTGGTVGKSYLVNAIPEKAIYAGYLIRTRFSDKINPQFIKFFMESNLYWIQLRNGTVATAQPNCNGQTLSKMIVPLPPLAEQNRIVERVEAIMSKLDELEKAEKELEALRKKFPGDMRDSLLQAAIQGKLTEQKSEDGNAKDLLKKIRAEKEKLIASGKLKKEKPLPIITDDEKPFEIPESWEWVRLGEIGHWQSGSTPPKTQPKFYGGNIPWLVTGDLNDGFINDDDIPNRITEEALSQTSVKMNPKGSVLIAMYGATIGKTAILNVNATTNQACCACLPMKGIFNEYLFLILKSLKQKFISMAEGGAQPNISKEKIVRTIFPLPPLAEQERIVERLNELLPLCEAMKGE